jgi:outer membrane protein OmpA-like peptidoglycan-associated protein
MRAFTLLIASSLLGLAACDSEAESSAELQASAGGEVVYGAPPDAEDYVASDDCSDQPVYFETDSAALTDECRAHLDKLAQCLITNEIDRIVVTGHADPRGTEPYNEELGMERARVVVQYLRAKGVTEPQAIQRTHGEAEASGHAIQWPTDRRTTIEVQEED